MAIMAVDTISESSTLVQDQNITNHQIVDVRGQGAAHSAKKASLAHSDGAVDSWEEFSSVHPGQLEGCSHPYFASQRCEQCQALGGVWNDAR